MGILNALLTYGPIVPFSFSPTIVVTSWTQKAMPTNISTSKCISYHRGALIFCSQKPSSRKRINQLAVQIIDAQNLQIVDKIIITSSNSIEIHTTSSLAAGKDLTLAEACNAVAKNNDPFKWIVLEKNKHCWGLFFAGGGFRLCRDQLRLYKKRSRQQPRYAINLLVDWLLKLSDRARNWQLGKQKSLHQTSEKIKNRSDSPSAARDTIVNKDVIIPIHQSLQQHRVTIDLPDEIIKQLDELGTMLGMTREESLKHLLRLVLLE